MRGNYESGIFLKFRNFLKGESEIQKHHFQISPHFSA